MTIYLPQEQYTIDEAMLLADIEACENYLDVMYFTAWDSNQESREINQILNK